MGKSGMGDSGSKPQRIASIKQPTPPAGASNSYEKVYDKLCSHDNASLGKMHYTREKMGNK